MAFLLPKIQRKRATTTEMSPIVSACGRGTGAAGRPPQWVWREEQLSTAWSERQQQAGDVMGDPTPGSARVLSPVSVAWSHVSEGGRTTLVPAQGLPGLLRLSR